MPKQRLDLKLVAAFLCLLAWCVYQVTRMWNAFPPDLSALYMAGWLFSEDRFNLIYAIPDGFFGGSPREWREFLPRLGLSGEDVLPYVYPPMWSAALAPLAGALTPTAFFRAFALVEIPMIAASVVLAWRMARPRVLPLWGWIFLSVALLSFSLIADVAIVQLQPQIIVIFLTLLAFERYGAGMVRLAGLLLAIAAMLKLAPAGLALIFVLDRNWTALRAFCLSCFTLLSIGLIFLGPQLHFQFIESVGAVSNGVFITSINYSVETLLQGLGIAQGYLPQVNLAQRNVRIDQAAEIVGLINKALLGVALIWMVRRTAAMEASEKLTARVIGVSLLISLFGPLGWAHYYLLQLLMLPALLGLAGLRRGTFLIAIIAFATSRPAFHDLREIFPGDLPVMAVGTCAMLLMFIAATARRAQDNSTEPAPVTA